MRYQRILPCITISVLVVGVLVGCSGESKETQAKVAQIDEQFAALEQSRGELAAVRDELAATTAMVAEIEAIEEKKRTDEQKASFDEATARIPELTTTLDAAYDDYQARLADFLNFALNEFPDGEKTAQGLLMYAEEAVYNANDIVRKSGDYKKAIDTVNSAKGYYEVINKEPAQLLLDKIAELEDWRYITRQRFDAVTKNMTEQQVRDTAGVPYYMNIKTGEGGVTFWLYPKREGGAAAIYFNKKNTVYATDFEAVKTKVADEG